jgi:signal transduction histidine kinase
MGVPRRTSPCAAESAEHARSARAVLTLLPIAAATCTCVASARRRGALVTGTSTGLVRSWEHARHPTRQRKPRAIGHRTIRIAVPVAVWLLEDVMQDVVALTAGESTARRVTVRAEITADLPVVSGDRVQPQQVLLNIVVNGMDAMEGVADERRLVEIHGRQRMHDGRLEVTVSVRDGGVGIDVARMERLFEAFYTTKPQGMGMGLAISRSIIEMHGGRLWAKPNDGFGATFSFSVPAGEGVRP